MEPMSTPLSVARMEPEPGAMRATKSYESAAVSTQAWWSCPGLLYFLAVGDPPIAIKVGMLAITSVHTPQTAMRRRLSSIQSSNHELVRVLGVVHFVQGRHPTKDAERELHLKFKHLARFQLGSRGAEWFNAAPDLMEEIGRLSQPPEVLGIFRTVATPIARNGG